MRWLLMFGLTLIAAGSARADEARGKPDDLFKMTKVWPIHITVSAKEWETMAPTLGGFPGFGIGQPPGGQPPRQPEPDEDRKPRGGFGNDFAYIKADVTIDGKTLTDVGLRFKGNSTYMMSQNGPKRPYKVDFDHYVENQTFNGVKKISLNNNVVDPTATRDVLSYALFRAAGVPAPRTAYAAVTLTVPGKYDKEYVGLYTIVESIDKPFLKDHFSSAKGLLLKPERLGSLDYLGEDWSAYEGRYQPKTDATKKTKQRLIDFTKLVNRADDETFKKEIASYVDMDQFTRFLACTVLLSSMDSFIGLGHNYYLYLDPKTNKFVFMPWDFDHSFGGFPIMGGADQLADLSIRQPYFGRNRLIERVLADEKMFETYKGHLKKLMETSFTPAGLKKDLAAINAAIAEVKEQEKKASTKRGGGGTGPFGRMPGMSPSNDLETFVRKRSESVVAQLDGKRKGAVVSMGFGPGGPGGPGGRPGGFGPGMFLTRPILEAADKDKDGKLSKDEASAAATALFKDCDKDGKKEIDEKLLAAGIEKLMPRPGGFGPGGPRPGGPGALPGGQPARPPAEQPARPPDGPRPMGGGQPPAGPGGFRFTPLHETLAKSIVEKAGKDGMVNEARLIDAINKVFTTADKNKDGKLDAQELGAAVNEFFPPPPAFNRPGGGPFGPPGGDRPPGTQLPGNRPPGERPARPDAEPKTEGK